MLINKKSGKWQKWAFIYNLDSTERYITSSTIRIFDEGKRSFFFPSPKVPATSRQWEKEKLERLLVEENNAGVGVSRRERKCQ